MDTLPLELYENILFFLSVKDKVLTREVNKCFESIINQRNLIIYRLDNKLKKNYNIDLMLVQNYNLNITSNNNLVFYMYNNYTVHSLFRSSTYYYNTCIDVTCKCKKLGTIFLPKIFVQNLIPKWYYKYMIEIIDKLYKRDIPYCLYCFNKWGTCGEIYAE